jgi:hypothetical protein
LTVLSYSIAPTDRRDGVGVVLNVVLGWQEVAAIRLTGTGLLSLGSCAGHGGARPAVAMLAARLLAVLLRVILLVD